MQRWEVGGEGEEEGRVEEKRKKGEKEGRKRLREMGESPEDSLTENEIKEVVSVS